MQPLRCQVCHCLLTISLLIHFAEVVVGPPFPFLTLTKTLLRKDFAVAAQNAWVRKGGAFTGEVRFHTVGPCLDCLLVP